MRTWRWMVAFIGLPLASQAAPRHEGQLWLAQATGDLRDESRASLGYGLSFGRLFHGAGWTARAELGYTGFSKSRTGRPVTLRTPQGEVHTQEAVEVTRNTVSLAFQGLWRPGGGRAGPYLGLGAGMAHWYEIEHLSVAQYREIQRRTTHLLVTAHLGFDAPSGGRTGTRWVVELRGARGAQFDGRTASWVALGAGLRF